MIFDDTQCLLGEGPLWSPDAQALYWFDILSKSLHRKGESRKTWQFDDYVSAAGRVESGKLLIASQNALSLFDPESGGLDLVTPLEADLPGNRSNDGRADPMGGFWIGTMAIDKTKGAGSIYRYYRGELRKLFGGITITNAICFDPDAGYACFTDTDIGVIQKVWLDDHGWPQGEPQPHIDLVEEGLNPDGAVIDAEGCLWSAQWGAGRVARYDADGKFMDAVDLPAKQISCPAFGGADLTTLFATSAVEDLDPAPEMEGKTFAVEIGVKGQEERKVIL
ncbi:SMP-30/gluconolactonase/LRE family protein [Paracoccaceae bacterium GXU_MW_L88]